MVFELAHFTLFKEMGWKGNDECYELGVLLPVKLIADDELGSWCLKG